MVHPPTASVAPAEPASDDLATAPAEPADAASRARREECPRCLRPSVTCYCAHVPSLDTSMRVVILQHRRESETAIGTARMAHLCLPRSELFVGVDFDERADVQRALEGRPHLLFPSDDATPLEDLVALPPDPLVVVDGTWWQARKLLQRNRILAKLPRIRFTPPRPSDYRIRREPADHCVATIEAIAHVLGVLENAPERFSTMRAPFDYMVETQLRYAREQRGARERHAARRARHPRRPDVPDILSARAADVVCVHGEANAWPMDREGGHPAELVVWLAYRPATGETFEAVVQPRFPLAPSTSRHVELSEQALLAGESLASFRARWAAFSRETDVLSAWGSYPLGLLAREGVAVPAERVDLRSASSRLLHGSSGGLDQALARIGLPEHPVPPWAPGRGGRRAAAVATLTHRLMTIGSGRRNRLPT